MDFARRLQEAAESIGVRLDAQQARQMEAFWRLLQEENQRQNLTGIETDEEAIGKHFLDSLSVLRMTSWPASGRVLDVGTGAGFPGIPLAISNPHLKVSLMESVGKKCQFLEKAARQLELSIAVMNMRAEDAGRRPLFRESFDAVVARALAPMPVACEWCLPLVRVGGVFIAMRGAQGMDDLQQAVRAIRVLGGEVEEVMELDIPGAGRRVLAAIRKRAATPARFPRPGGQARKRPL